jgi:hypothetical protein
MPRFAGIHAAAFSHALQRLAVVARCLLFVRPEQLHRNLLNVDAVHDGHIFDGHDDLPPAVHRQADGLIMEVVRFSFRKGSSVLLREDDHLGPVLRRAFRRVDGVTMYVFIAAWLLRPVWQWVTGDWQGLAFVLLSALACLLNLFIFVFMGLSGAPGLITAIAIIAINIRFFL